MAGPETSEISSEAFLHQIREFQVIAEAPLQKALKALAPNSNAKSVATHLLQSGILTRFQGSRLLQGQGASLRMGQYLILEELGRGGMGRVFRAEHTAMGRIVALKVLASDLVNSQRAKEFFLREVRAASRLNHPNIVTAFDANEVNGIHILVMELVQGPNLEHLVRERGPLPISVACEYARQVATGLDHATEHGMVHRDIKPSNLLLRPDATPTRPGLVKISDFGLARLAPIRHEGTPSSHGTIMVEANTIIGTPDYLAPEQARSLHQADIRSDIYSLGCTLYFLLTGKVPYPGTKGLEKIIKHSTDPIPNPSALVAGIPPIIDSIVGRMMAKEPADRYQTPREVATALAEAIGGDTGALPVALAVPAPIPDPFATFQSTWKDTIVTPFDEKFTPPIIEPARSNPTRRGFSGVQAGFIALVVVAAIATIAVAILRIFV
jgi:serine/threonine-protein kinase